jgi:hypothetical protein
LQGRSVLFQQIKFIVFTAQELLDQWAKEKLNFRDDYVDASYLETAAILPRQTPSEIKQEWDRLTETNAACADSSGKNKSHEGHYRRCVSASESIF